MPKKGPHKDSTTNVRVCARGIIRPIQFIATNPDDLELCTQERRHGNGALHKQTQLDATYTFLLKMSPRRCGLRRAVNFCAHARKTQLPCRASVTHKFPTNFGCIYIYVYCSNEVSTFAPSRMLEIGSHYHFS